MRHLIAALAVTAIVAAGCASRKTTVATANGTTVTTDTSGNSQTVTVNSSQGTATYGKGAVDPASLGLPVYPNATASDTAGYAAETKEGSGRVVVMATTDSFDKVYAWYRSQMPAGSEQMHMTSGNGDVATFAEGKQGDKTQKAVQISSAGDKTSIVLSSSAKP